MCVWQPKAAHAELEDASCWQQAPVCCWHLGRVFGRLPCWWQRSCLRGYVNRYPVNDLDELPECFVFLPDAVSPAHSPALCAGSAVHPRAGVGNTGLAADGGGTAARGRGVQSLLNKPTASAPVKMHLGCHDLCARQDLRIAFRLWLQGGVGGETFC